VTGLAERTAQLLALVLERSPRTVGELTGSDPLAHDDVRTALDALERHGLVAWDERRSQVRPGRALERFAGSGRDRAQLAQAAGPAMRRLAEESGETVNVMVPTPGGAEAILQVDGTHVLGVTNWVGREVPRETSAAGKVFLAYAGAPGYTDVRERGYATIVDELEVGLAAAAAPIRDADGNLIAALSVAGPTARLTPVRLDVLGRIATEQAAAISAALGSVGGVEDVLDALRSAPRATPPPPAGRP
jgi:DNA-binding IclR family transcriptional regulator